MSVKVSVSELDAQKAVFTRASKNLRSVMQTLNTAQKSIGSDKMFDTTRRQLAKLSELLEIRAFVLDALAEAMTAAAGGYKTAQTQSVRVVTECRAHQTDFYGNPVHVSAAAGAAGGAVGAAGSVTGAAGTVSAAPTAEAAGTVVTAEAPSASVEIETTGAQAVNVTQNITHIVNNYGDAEPLPGVDAGAAAAAGAAAVPAAGNASGGVSAGAAAAGMIGAAALGAAAYGFVEIAREEREAKKRENAETQVDDELAAARQKLRDIEAAQERIRAQASEETAEDSGKETDESGN